MKLLWTRIWISLATVLIALGALFLIMALHAVIAVKRVMFRVAGKKPVERSF